MVHTHSFSFMPIPVFGVPFYGGGYGVGAGVPIFAIMVMALVAFVAINALAGLFGGDGYQMGGDQISVVSVQVGLLGSARELQEDLNKIADSADTSTPAGLKYVLSETALSLLRNPQYCVYGTTTGQVVNGPEAAEQVFDELSMGERGKFEEETLTNVDARTAAVEAGAAAAAAQGEPNEYILVTVIAAADGSVQMPELADLSDLKVALKRLGALPATALQAVEVLWTPQQEGDVLTADELLLDYPTLRTL